VSFLYVFWLHGLWVGLHSAKCYQLEAGEMHEEGYLYITSIFCLYLCLFGLVCRSVQPDLRPGMRREVANWMLEILVFICTAMQECTA